MGRALAHTINEIKTRINNVPGVPYELKEQFYRGLAKREQADDMIERVRIELQRIDKWQIQKGPKSN